MNSMVVHLLESLPHLFLQLRLLRMLILQFTQTILGTFQAHTLLIIRSFKLLVVSSARDQILSLPFVCFLKSTLSKCLNISVQYVVYINHNVTGDKHLSLDRDYF